ncbi:DVU_1556 family methyltransferase [Paucidesulfovibrio longus]|uniref:DVU_1556 family methyltransferase n=1 Tax=Paucidesulfovibrio longus TaxID=889 RepID=UPI0003B55CB4|nr:class I SAM-dependent methyltransferase [Paucidesulfovibrio longus]
MPLSASDRCPAPLWVRPDARPALGETLRPGGFALTDAAAEALGLRPGMAVLDAGCGTGATVRRLRRRFGALALGIDLSPDPPEPPAHGSPLLKGSIDALPFGDGRFDAVFCECVLSLQHDPARVLAEFHRTLAPGGGLALSDLYLPGPDSACPTRTNAPVSCSGGALPGTNLLSLVRAAGFRVERFEDHSVLLRDLAAKLAWTGCAPNCEHTRSTGYFLLLARKPEEKNA